jgi:hypothetical protein
MGGGLTMLPNWPQTCDPPNSASQVAGITGLELLPYLVSHIENVMPIVKCSLFLWLLSCDLLSYLDKLSFTNSFK